MRNRLKFYLVLTLVLAPRMCLSWGEFKHPISELLIHHVCIDSNYVFCGSHAHWGTNDFGVFLFDRRGETWTNYPDVGMSGRRSDPITDFKTKGDWVSVEFHGGTIHRFNCKDGLHEIISNRKAKEPLPLGHLIKVEGTEYWINRDSIVVVEDNDTMSYRPAIQNIPKPTGVQPVPKALNLIFSNPLIYQNKLYLPYDLILGGPGYYTEGIAVFDIANKVFRFYRSDIFKGSVTGSFVHDSLIIFLTARFAYEGNASPAAGFVAFSPTDSSFFIWKGLHLPDEPLAIFQVAQDYREYWIGTDKGIFRVDKKTTETKHYQIVQGIVRKDTTLVHSGRGEHSPIAAELKKGQHVDIVAEWYEWCEIKSPRHIAGFVQGKFVAGVALSEDGKENICRFKPLDWRDRIPVRVSADPHADLMAELDASSLQEYEYKMVAKVAKQGQPTWYKIKLPTAWINMDDLVFQLGEVE
jgi:hypothetical protein